MYLQSTYSIYFWSMFVQSNVTLWMSFGFIFKYIGCTLHLFAQWSWPWASHFFSLYIFIAKWRGVELDSGYWQFPLTHDHPVSTGWEKWPFLPRFLKINLPQYPFTRRSYIWLLEPHDRGKIPISWLVSSSRVSSECPGVPTSWLLLAEKRAEGISGVLASAWPQDGGTSFIHSDRRGAPIVCRRGPDPKGTKGRKDFWSVRRKGDSEVLECYSYVNNNSSWHFLSNYCVPGDLLYHFMFASTHTSLLPTALRWALFLYSFYRWTD